MNAQEILSTLKKLEKPQTAAIYKRHLSGDNVYGVLTSEIVKLQKKIKVDHALALELWKTGNAEARILALQIPTFWNSNIPSLTLGPGSVSHSARV